MTVVVGMADKGNVWIGADSQTSRSDTACETRERKVFRRGELIFGVSGECTMRMVVLYADDFPEVGRMNAERYIATRFIPWLRSALKKQEVLTIDSAVATTKTHLVVGVRGKLFLISQDLSAISPKSGYITSGCGYRYALGSLSETAGLPPEQRVRRAVRAACLHDAHCGGPVRIVSSLKPKR